MTTWLHEDRLAAVREVLAAEGARSVADLGCGSGDLLIPLALTGDHERLAGLEPDRDALDRLRGRLARLPEDLRARVTLHEGSLLDPPQALVGVDAAVMVEVIEHIDPARLSAVERGIFARIDPRLLIVTTPNAEFNPLLGVPARRFRHPDHRFEWTRARFRDWAHGAARRWGRDVAFRDIGGAHPDLGGASQMAVFRIQTPQQHGNPPRA